MAEVKKVYIKRDNELGWMYVCPHCLRRIIIEHKMKSCYYCNGTINVNSCVIYEGKVSR